MYIIIVGAGNVGYHLAKAVLGKGHEVLLIDKDASILERIEDELGCIGLVGDGCEAATLDEAGATRADLLVAVTDHDEDNLVACQVAKHKFNVPRTIARVNDIKNQPLFKKLGIDVAVSSTNLILEYIETQMDKPPLLNRLMVLKNGDREIIEVKIPPTSPVVNRKIRDIALTPNTQIIGVVRADEKVLLPTPTTVIESTDRVILVSDRQSEEALYQLLTGS